MVYAFECERCQVKVYSASPNRTRGCPVCSQPMRVEPVADRGVSSPLSRHRPADRTLDPSARTGAQPV